MKKRVVSLLMICALSVGMLAGCGSSETQNQATGSADNTQTAGTETVAETKTPEVADDANLTATQQIIKQAEGMTMEELAQKAIEESNGKTFYGVGNPAVVKQHFLCSSSICSLLILLTAWNLTGAA